MRDRRRGKAPRRRASSWAIAGWRGRPCGGPDHSLVTRAGRRDCPARPESPASLWARGPVFKALTLRPPLASTSSAVIAVAFAALVLALGVQSIRLRQAEARARQAAAEAIYARDMAALERDRAGRW